MVRGTSRGSGNLSPLFFFFFCFFACARVVLFFIEEPTHHHPMSKTQTRTKTETSKQPANRIPTEDEA